MRKYGKIKIATQVEGHQNCTICHPENEADAKARARRQNKEEIEEQMKEIENDQKES